MLRLLSTRASFRVASQQVATMCASADEYMAFTSDRFGGVTVDENSIPSCAIKFEKQLSSSLDKWKSQGVTAAWLRVPASKTACLPAAIAAGFEMHHAQAEYVMLSKWLLPQPNLLPEYASHYVGIGGFTRNNRNQVLVVAERFALDEKSRWKFPGGLVKAGESLSDAVAREVEEETGVAVRMTNVVAFRHNLDYPGGFGCSDMYFCANCVPVDEQQIEVCFDPDEISDCRWMDVPEFLSHPDVYPFNKVLAELAIAQPHFVCDEMAPRLLPAAPGQKPSNYYRKGAGMYHGGPSRDCNKPIL